MNEKKYYTAANTYNDDTIRLLFRTEYFIYERLWVVIRMLIGFILVAAALLGHFGTVFTVIFLMIGCWLIASLDFPSKVRAEGLIQSRHGGTSRIELTFFESSIRVKGYDKTYSYTTVDRIVETEDYYFLFWSRQDALMIDKKTVSPSDLEGFRTFIKEKTGRLWQGTSFMLMNLKDIIQMIKDQKNR